MIPAYNAVPTLADTLDSVLGQDPGPGAMQIEVVDDCSTQKGMKDLVERISGGRIEYVRQPRNLGVAGNLNACIRRARGTLVHLLHADDLVMPGFYERMRLAFEAEPGIGAAFCRHEFVDGDGRVLSLSPLERDEPGVLDRAAERLAVEQRIMTPSIAVRRSVYENLGGFDERLVCAEDWEMWVRIAARYPIWYEPEPLACYRMHDESNTGRHRRSAEDVRYTGMAIALFAGHLSPELAARVIPLARATYARAALRTADALLERGDRAGAAAQLREALRLSRSRTVLVDAIRLGRRACLRALRRAYARSARSG